MLLVAGLLVAAGVVQAALPKKGSTFEFHDHNTTGKNWHVEFRVDPKDAKKLKTLVVYSQLCKGTIAKTDVPISDEGVIAANGGLNGGGTWEVNATFSAPTTVTGTMRMTRADCDTGVLSYPNAITGDGHTGHTHSGSAHMHGPKFADFDSATLRQSRQARRLHGSVLRVWRGVTPRKAAQRGFVRNPKLAKKPGVFHVYNRRYENDRRIFDARRPESLVFWNRKNGASVMLGAMFRVPPGKRPRFGGPIPIYHSHGVKPGKKAKNQMTHVWMVVGSRSAWSNCLPVWQLEQFNPAFKHVSSYASQHIGGPC